MSRFAARKTPPRWLPANASPPPRRQPASIPASAAAAWRARQERPGPRLAGPVQIPEYLRHHRVLAGVGIVALLLAATLAVVVHLAFSGTLPQVAAPESSKMLAADGTVIATFHGAQDRTIVPLSEISPNLADAVVSAEDRNFYREGGVSLHGIARAVLADVRSGGAAEGGSTITQQYVRNAFAQVGRQRTLWRKLKEVAAAEKLDRQYSKDKILEMYLNTVYFGRGAYGAEAAAGAYFGKTAKDLSLGEASYLAGILRSPKAYQPGQNAAGPSYIRNIVLADVRRDGLVPSDQIDAALAQPLDFSHGSGATTVARAAYFTEYVRRFLGEQLHFSDQDILTGGLQVSTTLDLGMQDAAEQAVATTLNQASDPEAALVAMSTDGSVRAMVGGRDVTSAARAQGFNFAYQRSGINGGRQAGSAFKPFTLATFLAAGFSVQSYLQGPPAIDITTPQCRNQDGSVWHVANFANESFGSLDITEATAHSVNTVYAQLVSRLGPKKVTDMAQQIGGWTSLQAVCSITLGTSPVTPLEMARAYSTFAGRGQRPDPIVVTKVVSTSGRVLYQQAPHRVQVLDPNLADTVTKVLTSVLDHGTAAGKGIGRPAAGKTGTTEKQTDAWFVGYTPNLTTAVWMGYPPDPATGQTPPMTNVHGALVTGGTLPATIWSKFMTAAVAGTPVSTFVEPAIGGRSLSPGPGIPACAPALLSASSASKPACGVPAPSDPCAGPGAQAPQCAPAQDPGTAPTSAPALPPIVTAPTPPPSGGLLKGLLGGL